MDDLRDENLEEHENADALLDDSIFEEVELDLVDEDELKPILLKDDEDLEEEEEEEDEILDELDALAAEEEDDELDFYGDEEDF